MNFRKHATSLVLVLAACGLGAYAWIDRSSVSVDERGKREHDVFVAWRREDLTKISLVHDRDTITLVRAGDRDGTWRMTAPWDGEVDAALVDRFLSTLEFATVVRVVDGQVPGFDTPRARGTIEMGSVKYEFALGPPAPTPEGASYFRMNGAAPIVVQKELAQDLMKGPDAFRTRTLVPYLSLDLTRLEVKGRVFSYTLDRKPNARAYTISDSGLRASRERLDKVWGAFAEMRAEAFVSQEDAEKATAEPEFRITMTPKDGKTPGELVIGGECPGHPNDVVVVTRAPVKAAACAPKGILEGLSVTQGWLVDTRLFGLHEDEIEALRLEKVPNGAVVDLARKGKGFRELAPQQRDLSEGEADAALVLVKEVARREGAILGRDAAMGAYPLSGRVTVTHAEAGEEEIIELGVAADDGGMFVRRRADGAIMQISAETLRFITPRATSTRPRALWPDVIAGKPIAQIETACAGLAQTVSRDGDAFRLTVDGAPLAADTGSILDAVDAFSRARADAWVADADDGTFGFNADPCIFHMNFAVDAGQTSAGVTFGAEGQGGTYAHLDGDPAVFVAPRGLRQQLGAPFLDRHRLVVDPFTIVTIEVAKKGAARRSFDPHGKDDAGILLGDDVAGILTEAVHMGAARPGEGFDAATEVIVHLLKDAGKPDLRFTVGDVTERGGRTMRFIRVPGVDATLAAPAGHEDALGRLFEAR